MPFTGFRRETYHAMPQCSRRRFSLRRYRCNPSCQGLGVVTAEAETADRFGAGNFGVISLNFFTPPAHQKFVSRRDIFCIFLVLFSCMFSVSAWVHFAVIAVQAHK